MDNKVIFKVSFFIGISLFLFSETLGQSTLDRKPSFIYESINEDSQVGFIKYIGYMASIADLDTTFIPSFQYLSVGKLKQLTVEVSGCVLAKIQYKNNQLIVFEAPYEALKTIENSVQINKWVKSLDTELGCHLFDEIKLRKNRYSTTKVMGNGIHIHMINIQEKNLKLFEYMISSVTFNL